MTDNLLSLEKKGVQLLKEGYLDTLRYMERPTLSLDDFKNLSGLKTKKIKNLAKSENATLAMRFIIHNLNYRIFPWLSSNRKPSAEELLVAKIAVASLIADQKKKTMLRNQQSHAQEEAVRKALINAGLKKVKGHNIDNLDQRPKPGEIFDREVSIGGIKADIVLGLFDGRIMALECKVSNSAVNSHKRLNHEIVDKIVKWNKFFDRNTFLGGCVLQGIFTINNLISAQQDGVAIFWSDNLSELVRFVLNTKQI